MDGLKVRECLIRLKQADKNISQRWLVRQLRKNGFGTLWEPAFTNILDGLKTASSEAILETALEILEKEADRLNIQLN
ncbi:MAG: hypothetical protein E7L17_14580 [Clostridium sp.]|uniref:hypothetical protein n=1 Tax=Clostridium sp. TaxID=1506 RepID=UPI00290E3DF6|nr:hypothetical protein [Clostridium sp.]MDU7339326.1 hypothetical protein [Clostridium sp.]